MAGGSRKTVVLFCAFAILGVSFFIASCGNKSTSSAIEQGSEEANRVITEGNTADSQAANTASSSKTIHMCGRSVLYGWFSYWGWEGDPATPVKFSGYDLYYHEMDSPPDITATALDVIRQMKLKGDQIMFFKLCFADFVGGDQDGARENLMANEEIIRTVVKAAVADGGLTLILGNALPTTKIYSDSWLTWNDREYNKFIDDLAAQYPGRVLILDLYGTLTTSDGWLRPSYATAPDDAHPNSQGYAALDKTLQAVLAQLNH